MLPLRFTWPESWKRMVPVSVGWGLQILLGWSSWQWVYAVTPGVLLQHSLSSVGATWWFFIMCLIGIPFPEKGEIERQKSDKVELLGALLLHSEECGHEIIHQLHPWV